MTVKLKEVPFKVQLFKVVASSGDIDWVITNRSPGSIDTLVVQKENQVCWRIEQLHRELKQLTGIEKCQCRKQRAQRTHMACCYQAWFSLKVTDAPSGRGIHSYPFYGSRWMTAVLRRAGYVVNRQWGLRLMRQRGLAAIYPKPTLSRPAPDQRVYPYLLPSSLGWR